MHRGSEGSIEDLDWTTRPSDTARAYAERKLHLVALAIALTQSWLAGGGDPATLTSGGYWHRQRRQEPAAEAMDVRFQDALLSKLAVLTNVRLA